MPLSAYGLCEAEMTQPSSAPSRPTSIATPGVGMTPAVSATPPPETMPSTRASSSAGPDSRVSRPRTTLQPGPGDGRRRGAELAGQVLGQVDAGDSPHAVCPEQLAERCQERGVSASRTAAACAPS